MRRLFKKVLKDLSLSNCYLNEFKFRRKNELGAGLFRVRYTILPLIKLISKAVVIKFFKTVLAKLVAQLDNMFLKENRKTVTLHLLERLG